MPEETFQMRVEGKIRTLDNGRSLKAYVDISLNNALIIKNIRVLEGRRGLFVSMPQHRARDGKWYDTIYCPNARIRSEINQFVLSVFKDNLASAGE